MFIETISPKTNKLREERHVMSLLTELRILWGSSGYKHFAPDGAMIPYF